MKVRFSGTLLRFDDYQKEIEMEASSPKELLAKVAAEYPKLGQALFDGEGKMRGLHRLFLNGEQVDAGALESQAKPTDELEIVTAIAGG